MDLDYEPEENVALYGSFHNDKKCCICHVEGKKTFKLSCCREEEMKNADYTPYSHYFCEKCIRLMFDKFKFTEGNVASTTEYYCDSCLTLINIRYFTEFIDKCKQRPIKFAANTIEFSKLKSVDKEYVQSIDFQCYICTKWMPLNKLISNDPSCDHGSSYRCPLMKCCGHYICRQCLVNCLKKKLTVDEFVDIDTITCFNTTKYEKANKDKEKMVITNCRCKYSIIIGQQSKDLLSLFTKLKERAEKATILCPKCNKHSKVMSMQQKKFICACKNEICRLCKQDYHIGLCKNEDREKLLKDDKLELHPCPYCLEVISKVEGCNHMTCRRCKGNFCLICSARRGSITAHGNHYHRPSCKYMSPYEDNSPYDPACIECVKYNEVNKLNPKVRCPLPKDLVNCDIPIDELKMYGFD
jgi:hypothetical protein